MNELVIYTEAGQGIGYGHFMRCKSIADAFSRNGFKTNIILYLKGEEGILDKEIQLGNWHQDSTLRNGNNKTLAIIDSYLAGAETYAEIASTYQHVCAIDDFNRIVYPVPLVLNPGVTLEQLDYSNQTGTLLMGKDYIVIRKEFKLANRELQSIHTKIEHVVITIGGSDVHNISAILCEIIKSKLPRSSITLISPDHHSGDNLNHLFPDIQILGQQTADEMIKLYQASDLVICGCGQTLHELAYLGTPAIGIFMSPDQKLNQNFYLNQGFQHELIAHNDLNLKEKIEEQIQLLIGKQARLNIHQKSLGIVPKDGAEIACKSILSSLGIRPNSVA